MGVDAFLDPAHALLQRRRALRDAGHLLGEAGEQVVRRLQEGGQLPDGAAQGAIEDGLQLIVLDEGLAVRARQLGPAHVHGLHRSEYERHVERFTRHRFTLTCFQRHAALKSTSHFHMIATFALARNMVPTVLEQPVARGHGTATIGPES